MSKIPSAKKVIEKKEQGRSLSPPKKNPILENAPAVSPRAFYDLEEDDEDEAAYFATIGDEAIGPEKKVPSPYKPGRKEKTLSWDKFEAGCALLATQEEIAGLMGISEVELINRAQKHYGKPIKEVYHQFSHQAKMGIRRSQIRLARRNPVMAIWLGKVILGQREHETKDTKSGEVLDAMHEFILAKNEELKIEKQFRKECSKDSSKAS